MNPKPESNENTGNTYEEMENLTEKTGDTEATEPENHPNPPGQAEEAGEDVRSEKPETKADGEKTGLEAELEEMKQRLLRLQADFDNFRRRSRQEKEQIQQYAAADLIEQLLPVLDNFERALAATAEHKDADALAKGVDMIYRQLMQILQNEGLTPIEATGKPFDPALHQAVMQVESADHEEGTVVEEMQKGYKIKDRVLRPSMVKVSKK